MGCSSALLDSELEMERRRLALINRRTAEELYFGGPIMQWALVPVETTSQLRRRSPFWSDYSASAANDPLGQFPSHLSDRPLSEVWRHGFRIGMES